MPLARHSRDPEDRQPGDGQLRSPGLPSTNRHPVWALSQQDEPGGGQCLQGRGFKSCSLERLVRFPLGTEGMQDMQGRGLWPVTSLESERGRMGRVTAQQEGAVASQRQRQNGKVLTGPCGARAPRRTLTGPAKPSREASVIPHSLRVLQIKGREEVINKTNTKP